MTATLLHGDCLELMKTLPDKSVDCFICDLPYGQLSGANVNKTLVRMEGGKISGPKALTEGGSLSGCPWDVKLNLTEFWTQVKRLCKNDHTPVLMFCNTQFGFELYNSNPSWFRYDLVWDKGHGVSFLLANKMPMKSHEMIYVFSKKGCFYRRIDDEVSGAKPYTIDRKKEKATKSRQFSVIKSPSKLAGGHPTEKPLELYKWLLERYCPEGGTVLDPTAGSFNSILAARELKRNGIGIEKEDKFYEEGCKKFKASAATPAPTELRNEVVLTPVAHCGNGEKGSGRPVG